MAQAGVDATERIAEQTALANLQARGQSIGQRGGDINAQLSGRSQDITQNFGANTATQAGLNAVGQAQNNLLAPSETQISVGDQRRFTNQQFLDDANKRFNFAQQAPDNALDALGRRTTLQFPQGTTETIQGTPGTPLQIAAGAQQGFQFARDAITPRT